MSSISPSSSHAPSCIPAHPSESLQIALNDLHNLEIALQKTSPLIGMDSSNAHEERGEVIHTCANISGSASGSVISNRDISLSDHAISSALLLFNERPAFSLRDAGWWTITMLSCTIGFLLSIAMIIFFIFKHFSGWYFFILSVPPALALAYIGIVKCNARFNIVEG